MTPSTYSRTELGVFLLTALCLTSLPARTKYSGGTGEPNDPFQIATAADLIALGETPENYDKHLLLTADIDLDPNLPGRKVFDKAVIAQDASDPEWMFQGTPSNDVLDTVLTASAILCSTTGTFTIGREPVCYGYLWNG